MATTANIHEFARKCTEEYLFLYDHNDNVAGYSEAVDAFDTLLKYDDFKSFVGEYCDYIQDFVSSDREAAAFMFTMESMGLLENETRI